MFKTLFQLGAKPVNLALCNAVLIVILITLNIYFQAFCIPSGWAIVLLSVCFSNTIVYPLPQLQRHAALTGFINGLSFVTFLYCILFLEHINLAGLILLPLGIGLIILAPHFFVLQLFWKNVVRPVSAAARSAFLLALVLCIFAALCIGKMYGKAVVSLQRFRASHYTELDKSFMTEKILGMHFIYHTRVCEFDGWRPPIHEPILVIGLWMNHRLDPLPVSLEQRLYLYRHWYPEKPYKFPCSCGKMYSEAYHKDQLWNTAF